MLPGFVFSMLCVGVVGDDEGTSGGLGDDEGRRDRRALVDMDQYSASDNYDVENTTLAAGQTELVISKVL